MADQSLLSSSKYNGVIIISNAASDSNGVRNFSANFENHSKLNLLARIGSIGSPISYNTEIEIKIKIKIKGNCETNKNKNKIEPLIIPCGAFIDYIDLKDFLRETTRDVIISNRAHLILNIHKEFAKNGGFPNCLISGDTSGGVEGRLGIDAVAIAAHTKFIRNGVRVHELEQEGDIAGKITSLVSYFNQMRDIFIDYDSHAEAEDIREIFRCPRISIRDTTYLINSILDNINMNGYILVENHSHIKNDVDFGSPSENSHGSTISGVSCAYIGVSPKVVNLVIGVVSLNSLCIGDNKTMGVNINDADDLSNKNKNKNKSVTIDLNRLRYTCTLNGFDFLVIQNMEVVNGVQEIFIISEDNNNSIDNYTANKIENLCCNRRIIGSYDTEMMQFLNNSNNNKRITIMTQMPNVHHFVEAIEEICGTPVGWIGYRGEYCDIRN